MNDKDIRERVFEVTPGTNLELMNRLKHDFRGEERESLNARADLTVMLHDNSEYDSGTAIIKNVGRSGALVTNILLHKKAFPTEPFRLKIRILEGKYQHLEAECRPVRFATEEGFGVGVTFDEIFVQV